MMPNPARGLEERLRHLEAGFEVHQRELESLRLRLVSSAGTFPGQAGRDPRAVVATAPRESAATVSGPEEPQKVLSEDSRAEAGRSSEGVWRGLELPVGLANLRRWEWWMNKVGMALFLMGVVFLFKFSWDRGWLQAFLTPVVRVGIGILLLWNPRDGGDAADPGVPSRTAFD